MSKQVLDIEQMRHLRELGLDTTKASMCWLKDTTGDIIRGKAINMSKGWNLDFNNPFFYKYDCMIGIPTFTLQDILDLLPKELDIEVFTHKWFLYIDYQHNSIRYAYASETGFYYLVDPIFCLSKHALIDAAYEMLCWCIEKGYIKNEQDDNKSNNN